MPLTQLIEQDDKKKISKDREHVPNRINTSDLMVTYKIL